MKIKKLNKQQEAFMLVVSRNVKDCVRTIGRCIYKTDVSAYATRNFLLGLNLIKLNKIKNKEIPTLTLKGKEMVEEIYKRKINSKKLSI